MGGKFINKTYVDTINSLNKGTINRVKNANYLFNDKTPIVCKYWYNMNKEGTSFDEGTHAEYTSIGKNSPILFNRISDAVFYSSQIRLEFDIEYDDDGLGVPSPPTITGVVLPNTYIPYAGDYFVLQSTEDADKGWYYRVISTSFDTIDNGNNVWKFEAKFDQKGYEEIDKQVVRKYKFVTNNIGTGYNVVIEEENYNSIEAIDYILSNLKKFYTAMFYNDQVQTFTCQGTYGRLYDPYLIEFMIRNNIMDGSDEYIYVHHEVPIPRTFSIEYMDTYWRALETRSVKDFNNKECIAEVINNPYTLFSSVYEDYFMISYTKPGLQPFQTLDSLLEQKIKTNEKIEAGDPKEFYNIIIDYMNGKEEISENLVDIFDNLKFKPDVIMFYTIPMLIYILDNAAIKLMK